MEAFVAHERRLFSGLALAIVRAVPGSTGTITLHADGDALQGTSITLESRAPEHP